MPEKRQNVLTMVISAGSMSVLQPRGPWAPGRPTAANFNPQEMLNSVRNAAAAGIGNK